MPNVKFLGVPTRDPSHDKKVPAIVPGKAEELRHLSFGKNLGSAACCNPEQERSSEDEKALVEGRPGVPGELLSNRKVELCLNLDFVKVFHFSLTTYYLDKSLPFVEVEEVMMNALVECN